MSNWNPWTGGENPAPGCVVEVIYRGGGYLAGFIEGWDHDFGPLDIIAYRIVESERDRVVRSICDHFDWAYGSLCATQVGEIYDAGYLKDPDVPEKMAKVPEPEWEPLKFDDKYWYPAPYMEDGAADSFWRFTPKDERLLERGYVYRNKEDAQARERAMRWEKS